MLLSLCCCVRELLATAGPHVNAFALFHGLRRQLFAKMAISCAASLPLSTATLTADAPLHTRVVLNAIDLHNRHRS